MGGANLLPRDRPDLPTPACDSWLLPETIE